jgi:hypothetical protein
MAAPYTANQLLTLSYITPDAAAILSNNLQICKNIAHDWDDDFGVKAAQIGQTINVRRPSLFNPVRVGNVAQIQAVTQTYSSLTFTDPWGIDTAFTSVELTFDYGDVSKNLVAPVITRIANYVEQQAQNLILQVYNMVGTPGTALTGGPTGTALDTVLQAVALLYDNDAPVADGMLSEYNSPSFNAKLASNNRTLFNPTKEIGDIYHKGLQGEFADAMHYIAQLVLPHTNGTWTTGTYTVTTATTNPPSTANVFPRVGTLVVSGFGNADQPNVGDIFVLETGGVPIDTVNPQSKQDTGIQQQFTVQSATNNGSGTITFTYTPALTSSGPYQNVTAQATNATVLSFVGGSGVTTQNALVIHRNAFMMANKDLDLPKGVDFADYIKDPDTKTGIRYVRMFDIRVNQIIDRFDTMVAFGTLYEQLACRIATT